MSEHQWTAIFSLNLTDKEAAQAYTFDLHGRKVVASKISKEDGEVQVGCVKCEEPYQIALNKECVEQQ